MSHTLEQGNVAKAAAWLLLGVLGGLGLDLCAKELLETYPLVGGAIAGFLVWGEVPDRWVIAGAIIIVGSGIFVVYRGEARKQAMTTAD